MDQNIAHCRALLEMRQDRKNCFSIIRERLLELLRNVFKITFFGGHIVTFTCLVYINALTYVTTDDLLIVSRSNRLQL